jgi:hypothetical protein
MFQLVMYEFPSRRKWATSGAASDPGSWQINGIFSSVQAGPYTVCSDTSLNMPEICRQRTR